MPLRYWHKPLVFWHCGQQCWVLAENHWRMSACRVYSEIATGQTIRELSAKVARPWWRFWQ